MAANTNQYRVFDLTSAVGEPSEAALKERNLENDETRRNEIKRVQAFFRKHCEIWSFQIERGEETGYVHYQARIKLKGDKKIRTTTLQKQWSNYFIALHLSPTSSANRTNNFYVTKADTRLYGPWTSEDKKKELDDESLPRDLRGCQPSTAQQTILNSRGTFDTRTINCIVDLSGHHGKSWLTRWIMAKKLGYVLPPMNDFKEVIQFYTSCLYQDFQSKIDEGECPDPGLVVIDMPRAVDKKRLTGLFSAIERIKDGIVFDGRYEAKRVITEPPIVWVYSNQLPNTKWLSADRWKFWCFEENGKMINDKLDDYDLVEMEVVTRASRQKWNDALKVRNMKSGKNVLMSRKAFQSYEENEHTAGLYEVLEDAFSDALPPSTKSHHQAGELGRCRKTAPRSRMTKTREKLSDSAEIQKEPEETVDPIDVSIGDLNCDFKVVEEVELDVLPRPQRSRRRN